jgi:hypothetical protein
MNKLTLLHRLRSAVMVRISAFERSAQNAHAEATDEQNKAESKYDTRALEASYLAEGQTRQAAEAEQAFLQLEAFEPRAFGVDDSVDIGALLELEARDKVCDWYFLAPCAGGTELEFDGRNVLVLTAQSPLGAQLIGARLGGKVVIKVGARRSEFRVKSLF